MMKAKSRIFIFSMLLVLTLGLSACSNNNPTPNNNSAISENNTQGNAESVSELRPPLSERRMRITVDDTDIFYAMIADSRAANIFAENLPFTIEMDDYINRNKRGPLPFTIDREDMQNIIYPFEIGDIIYYPPTTLLGIFYDHNNAEISAGYELVGALEADGIEAFKAYTAPIIKVTVELSE